MMKELRFPFPFPRWENWSWAILTGPRDRVGMWALQSGSKNLDSRTSYYFFLEEMFTFQYSCAGIWTWRLKFSLLTHWTGAAGAKWLLPQGCCQGLPAQDGGQMRWPQGPHPSPSCDKSVPACHWLVPPGAQVFQMLREKSWVVINKPWLPTPSFIWWMTEMSPILHSSQF